MAKTENKIKILTRNSLCEYILFSDHYAVEYSGS
jgi:hypothetical protein